MSKFISYIMTSYVSCHKPDMMVIHNTLYQAIQYGNRYVICFSTAPLIRAQGSLPRSLGALILGHMTPFPDINWAPLEYRQCYTQCTALLLMLGNLWTMVMCSAYGCNNRTDRNLTKTHVIQFLIQTNIQRKRNFTLQVSSLCLYQNPHYFLLWLYKGQGKMIVQPNHFQRGLAEAPPINYYP